MNRTDLRIIGISLAILSLGLAIAWAGFIYFTQEKEPNPPIQSPPLQQPE